MKLYKVEKVESQASPLYNVVVENDDGSTFAWQLAISDEKNIDAEVKAAFDRIQNPVKPKQPEYQDKRRSEYPPMEDYLDGIVKNDQQQIQRYIQACLAVKAKYPKE